GNLTTLGEGLAFFLFQYPLRVEAPGNLGLRARPAALDQLSVPSTGRGSGKPIGQCAGEQHVLPFSTLYGSRLRETARELRDFLDFWLKKSFSCPLTRIVACHSCQK